MSTSAFVLVDALLPIGNHTISEYLPENALIEQLTNMPTCATSLSHPLIWNTRHQE